MTKNFKLMIAVLLATINMNLNAQSVDDGIKAVNRGQNEKGKNIFLSITRSNTKDARAWYYLGKSYIANKQFDSAKYAFSQGNNASATEPLNVVGTGLILQCEGKTAEAKTYFDKANAMGKNKDLKIMQAIAEANLVEEHLNADYAITILSQAKGINPKDFETCILQGDAFLMKSDGTTANKYYEEAMGIDNKNPRIYMRLGELYNRARNTDEAKNYYEKAITLDVEFAPAYKELGTLYSRASKFSEAADYYKKYLDKVGNSTAERIRYIKFIFLNKEYDNVIKEYTDITARDTTRRPELMKIAAYSYFETKQHEKSLQIMKEYFSKVSAKKLSSSDYELLGKLYDKTQNDSLAVANYRIASDMDTSKYELYSTLADKYYDLRKYTDAEKYMVLKLSKKSLTPTNDHFTLGKIYYHQNIKEKNVLADSEFSYVQQKVPNEPKVYLWRGRVNSRMDPDSKNGTAKPFYETFIEKATDPKYKNDVGEAYQYLAFYYYQKKDFANSKNNATKCLEADPKNAVAKQLMNYFSQLEKAKQQQKNGGK